MIWVDMSTANDWHMARLCSECSLLQLSAFTCTIYNSHTVLIDNSPGLHAASRQAVWGCAENDCCIGRRGALQLTCVQQVSQHACTPHSHIYPHSASYTLSLMCTPSHSSHHCIRFGTIKHVSRTILVKSQLLDMKWCYYTLHYWLRHCINNVFWLFCRPGSVCVSSPPPLTQYSCPWSFSAAHLVDLSPSCSHMRWNNQCWTAATCNITNYTHNNHWPLCIICCN